jgi:glutamine amidotransferase
MTDTRESESTPDILAGPWPTPRAVIVDYCAGNLFSVVQACHHAGLSPTVTSQASDLFDADVVILPGVGAFGEAMASLRRLDLVHPLRDYVQAGRLFVGICLGMQLTMTASDEFGRHEGLNLVDGDVQRLPNSPDASNDSHGDRAARIPNVGWRTIQPAAGEGHWRHAALRDTPPGAYMYFVHSFRVRPAQPSVVLSETQFGQERFCSSLAHDNVWGFQFHPEKSGPLGLGIYRRIAREAVRCLQRRATPSTTIHSKAA